MNADSDRCEFKRVDLTRADGEYIAHVTGNQISSRLMSCSSAKGLFRLKSKKLEKNLLADYQDVVLI